MNKRVFNIKRIYSTTSGELKYSSLIELIKKDYDVNDSDAERKHVAAYVQRSNNVKTLIRGETNQWYV